MLRDFTYSLRVMRHAPRFSAVTVLTLALAIGANTAIFSLLDALVLRAIPARAPDELVQLTLRTRTGQDIPLSFAAFQRIAADKQTFASVTGWSGAVILTVEANRQLTHAFTWAVTGNAYAEFPIKPALGRFLIEADAPLDSFTPGHVAVLGYGFWQRQFGGDPHVIGHTIRVEGAPFEVVGVAPAGFRGFARTVEPDVTVPLTAHAAIFPGPDYAHQGNVLWVNVVARRRPEVSLEQARARVETLMPTILADTVPASYTRQRRDNFLAFKPVLDDIAMPADRYLRTQYVRPLWIVLGIAAVVLVIACVNLAFMVFARALRRTYEFSVRLALGAHRWIIARQLLCEGLLLAAAGTAGGLALAGVLSATITRAILGEAAVPTSLDTALHARVALFAIGIGLLASVLFCVIPVWRLMRRQEGSLHGNGGARTSASSRSAQTIVGVQIALSVMLLTNVGLLVRSFRYLESIAPGFAVQDINVAYLERQPGAAPIVPQIYWRSLLEAVTGRAGGRTAALARSARGIGTMPAETAGVAGSTTDMSATVNEISPGFFNALSIPMLAGRDFTWDDSAPHPPMAIISRGLAVRLFGKTNVVGERIRLGTAPGRQAVEIVGVVEDVRDDVRQPNVETVYVPLAQSQDAGAALLVQGQHHALAAIVQSLGHDYISSIQPLAQLRARAIMQERVTVMIAEWFGSMALLFVAIGTYGLLAYVVANRTREYGIRLALGARPSEITAGVLTRGLRTAAIGGAIGLAGALVSAQAIKSLLHGVSIYDALTLVGTVALILVIAVVTALWPALRAGRVAPAEILRAE